MGSVVSNLGEHSNMRIAFFLIVVATISFTSARPKRRNDELMFNPSMVRQDGPLNMEALNMLHADAVKYGQGAKNNKWFEAVDAKTLDGMITQMNTMNRWFAKVVKYWDDFTSGGDGSKVLSENGPGIKDGSNAGAAESAPADAGEEAPADAGEEAPADGADAGGEAPAEEGEGKGEGDADAPEEGDAEGDAKEGEGDAKEGEGDVKEGEGDAKEGEGEGEAAAEGDAEAPAEGDAEGDAKEGEGDAKEGEEEKKDARRRHRRRH